MSDRDRFQAEGVDVSSVQKEALDALVIPEGERITVHMVHLNHLDLTWYWRLPDTIEMCLETIRWHTEMLERHPDARYTHTQVFTLKVVEQVDPALFARFAKLVAEGRVELDSGQLVEPDHNMPEGESLARQFLYGQSFLQSRFGLRAQTLINSDSFGHNRNLPQIMKLAGIRHFLFKRPRQKFVDLPEVPFIWRGIDGTGIVSYRFLNKGGGLPALSQYYELPEGMTGAQEKVNRNLAVGIRNFIGTHCGADSGGVTAYVPPCAGEQYTLRYGLPTEFFESLLAEGREFGTVERPLNFVYEGCYTTHIEEKEHCRRAERELREVELLWTLASLMGHGYPSESIAALWWRTCFLQFHDILPGTGSPEAHQDSSALYHEVFLGANILRRKAQILLDECCPRSEALRSFLVANPGAVGRSRIAAADVEMPIVRGNTGAGLIPTTGVMIDESGEKVAYQIVGTRVRQRYVRGTMLFAASNVPAMGLKAFHMAEGETESAVRAEGSVVENEHLRVEVGGPGLVKSIVTKADGREWLRASDAPVRIELWPESEYIGDYGSPMEAWMLGITEAREQVEPVGGPEVTENGPVRASIKTRHAWGGSAFATEVSLYAGQDYVELRFEIDWHESEVLARMCVEPRLTGDIERTYGIAFGAESATGEELEVPAVGWADMSGADGGVALLDADRPGHTFRDNSLRVSLVRCAPGSYDPCTDSGTIRAAIRILPHAGSRQDAGVAQKSDEFRHPLLAWQVEPSARSGEQPLPLRLEGDGVILTACKVSESGEGYVIRLHESAGRNASAVLALGEGLANHEVFESNLLEDAVSKLDSDSGQVKLEFHPFEIKTVLVAAGGRVADVEMGFAGTFFGR